MTSTGVREDQHGNQQTWKSSFARIVTVKARQRHVIEEFQVAVNVLTIWPSKVDIQLNCIYLFINP